MKLLAALAYVTAFAGLLYLLTFGLTVALFGWRERKREVR